MKIGWIRAWATAELLWTSFKERKKRWGKLIDAPETKANKNTHRSRGMVWKWEIGHKEWHVILKKRQAASESSTDVIWGSVPHWIEDPVKYDMTSSKGGDSS